MTVAPTACPHCHLTHATDWAVAVDRWRPEGPAGYRARYPDAPLRATRAEAIADMCARHAVLPPGCTCPDERHIPDIALQPGMRVVTCRSVYCPTSRALHFHTIQPDQGCLIHGGNPS